MQSRLDILQKAAQYVENLHQENACDPSERNITSKLYSPLKSSLESIAEENCTADKQANNENIRLRDTNDVSIAAESPSLKYSHHHNNGPSSHFKENIKVPLTYHSSNSSGVSLFGRKGSSPKYFTSASDRHPQGAPLPQQFGDLPTITQPNTQAPTASSAMSFVPSLAYQGFDPALYASILARQGLNKPSSDAHAQSQSSSSSPSFASPNANLQNQELQHLMQNLSNPALLVGHPGVAAAAVGFAENPLLTQPYLASYGQAANMLSQLASYGSLSDRENETKRVLENMTLPLSSQFLASPPFKPVLDPSDLQDRTVPKPRLSVEGGLPAGLSPDVFNYLLHYQEALNNEILKLNPAYHQSSPYNPSRSSVSPEINHKTTSTSRSAVPTHFRAPYSSDSARPKSPIPERIRNSPYHHHEPRSEKFHLAEIEARFSGDRKLHLDDKHGNPKLVTTAQRPQNGAIDPALLQNYHHSSTIPLHKNNGWEDYCRSLEERSSSASFQTEKSSRKRSYEQFGIPPDLIPDSEIHSPRLQTSSSEKIIPKLHQDAGSNSPANHLLQQATAANTFAALSGKSQLGLSEKDAAAYLASVYPYMFHPAMMGASPLPANPYVLPSNVNPLVASNNPVNDRIAASLAASPFLQPSLPTEALPEYARMAGIAPYISLLNSQHAFNPHGSAPKSSPSQNYAAEALKQTALQQSLRESKEKEQHPTPPHPTLTSMRPFLSNSISSKAARNSSSLNHDKAILKHSSQHPMISSSVSSSTSSSWSLSKDVDTNIMKRKRSPENQGLHSASIHSDQSFALMRRLNQDRSNTLKREASDVDDKGFFNDAKRKREVTADADVPDVDEHFRRSLKGAYRDFKTEQNTVSITGTVEDHFKKSLGKELWRKTKSSSKLGSSNVGDQGQDTMFGKIASSQFHPSPPPLNLSHLSASATSLNSHPDPLKMFAGNALLKSGETVLLESISKLPLTSGSSAVYSDRVRSESLRRCVDPTTLPPGSKESSEFHPNFSPQKSYHSCSPSADSQPKPLPLHIGSSPHSTLSPTSEKSYGLNLSNFVQNHASLKVQTSPYTSSPLDDASNTDSPAAVSPAYSPHSSASASSRPPTTSPRRISMDGRVCDNPKPSAPMPVHT